METKMDRNETRQEKLLLSAYERVKLRAHANK